MQFATGLHVTEVMADFATLIPVRKKPTRQVLAFEKVTDVPFEEVKIELEDYSAILFRLDNGAPGSFTTSQATIGRKSDTEFQVYGSSLLLRLEPQEVERAVDRASRHAQRDADREPRPAEPRDRLLRLASHRSPAGLP